MDGTLKSSPSSMPLRLWMSQLSFVLSSLHCIRIRTRNVPSFSAIEMWMGTEERVWLGGSGRTSNAHKT